MKAVIFGGVNYTETDAYYKSAYEFGRVLARSGITVISGGYGGIMEAVSRGAAEEGGHTIGVTFEYLPFSANKYIKEEIKKPNLLERTETLIRLGDLYIAFPGGTGTLMEIALVLEFLNKRVISLRPLFLVGEYWRPVIDTIKPELRFADPRFEWGTKRAELISYVKFVSNADQIIEYLGGDKK